MEPYVVLARRYRPRTFPEVLGQEAIARTLVQAIQAGRVAHAYLFAGPRGIGKTSMARILAKALCCLETDGPSPEPCHECGVCTAIARGDDLDVIEIDGASNRGIDEVRTLRENALFTPARARVKIYIIDEVHMLTEAAFNALLKILEEPPPHVKFVFATTEPQKVPTTILSRCQRFDFRRIPTRTIVANLARICEGEGVTADEAVLHGVARASAGGMRDAQSLLDQLITLGAGQLRPEDLASLMGTVSPQKMEELCRAIGAGDEARAIALYEDAHDQGIDPAEFLKQTLTVARDLLVLLSCGDDTDLVDLTPEERHALAEVAKEWGRPRVLYALGILSETLKTVKAVGEGRALVELALVKLAAAGKLRSLDEILADLADLEQRIGAGSPTSGPGTIPAPAAPEPEERQLFRAALPEGAIRGEGADLLTIERVRELWPAVLERINEGSSAVGSYLVSGRVLGLTDDAVTVGFPPKSRFQKTQLDDPDHIRLVERAIVEVLGSGLRVETAVTEGAGEPEAPAEGEAETPEQPARVSREEVERIGREPIVNALKELFQARLVNIERT
ncbi:MAG: DNA polymerase III subunit gamma/tau [Planctomycetota bacterium]